MKTEDRVTIRDVARLAGVSKSTVSMVLNGGAGVAEDTARRVRDMLARTGYRRDPSAARFRSRRGGPIAVVLSSAPDGGTGALLAGLSARLQEARLPMLLTVAADMTASPIDEEGACALVTDRRLARDPVPVAPVVRLHGESEGAMRAGIDCARALRLAARAARAAGAERLIVAGPMPELGDDLGDSAAGLPIRRALSGGADLGPEDALLCAPSTGRALKDAVQPGRLVVLGRDDAKGNVPQIHWDALALGRAVGDALVTRLANAAGAPGHIMAPVWLSMPPRPA